MKGKLAETLRELAETIKVFPAHAGVIPFWMELFGTCRGVPRACGGDPSQGHLPRSRMWCSPRMRGVIPDI